MDESPKASVFVAREVTSPPLDQSVFIAPTILRRGDADRRRERLAQLVAAEIIPRLVERQTVAHTGARETKPTTAEIVELAHLAMSPRLDAGAEFVGRLREQGVSMETLFVDLLQPAAQHLGTMWDNDECDFIDVTLGVGHLQALLAYFNATHDIPHISRKRRVLLTLTPGEQHSFGLHMVAKLMRGAGWDVTTDVKPTVPSIVAAVSTRWYAVAGVTLSSERGLAALKSTIAAVRDRSRNPAIGIMVGGPMFNADPALVREVGADATSLNATTAVILAQKLFDLGARANWAGTEP